MSRAERERLIERYLGGEMSPAEEQDFFIEVAASNELRHELKAYQVVDRVLGRDRAARALSLTALRAGLQQKLSVSHPASNASGSQGASAQHAAAQSAPTQGTATGSGATAGTGTTGTLGSAIGAGVVPLKWFITAVVAAALAAGTLVVMPLLERKPVTVDTPTRNAPPLREKLPEPAPNAELNTLSSHDTVEQTMTAPSVAPATARRQIEPQSPTRRPRANDSGHTNVSKQEQRERGGSQSRRAGQVPTEESEPDTGRRFIEWSHEGDHHATQTSLITELISAVT